MVLDVWFWTQSVQSSRRHFVWQRPLKPLVTWTDGMDGTLQKILETGDLKRTIILYPFCIPGVLVFFCIYTLGDFCFPNLTFLLYSWSSTSYGCTLESPASCVKQERPRNKPFHNLSTEKAEAMIGRYTSYFDQHVVWFIVRLVWLSWMFGWQRYTHVNHHLVKKKCMLMDASVLN